MVKKTSALVCVATAVAAVPASASTRGGSNARSNILFHPPSFIPRGGVTNDEPRRKRKFRKRRRKKEVPPSEEQEDSNLSGTSASKDGPDGVPAKPEVPTTPPSSPGPPQIVQDILKESDYYKILGTSKQAAKSNPEIIIKKAYRRRAVQTHPDKTGGDRRAFDKVAKAYDVLSDANKRQIYDRYGEKGLEHGAGGGSGFAGNAEDMFRAFFGGSRGNSNYTPPSRNRTVRYQLEVSLEDIYRGVTQKVGVSAPAPQHHPFMQRHRTSNPASKTVEVSVPRGAQDGEAIVLSGEMDFDSSDTPGDVVFLVQQRQHPVYTRRGYDLAIVLKISLQEAICGLTRTLQHLDGRFVTVASQNPDSNTEILQSGDVHVLEGEGMPKDANGNEFGDMYIQYEVEMPTAKRTSLNKEDRQELKCLLDKLEGKSQSPVPDTKDAKVLSRASVRDFGIKSGRPPPPDQHAYEEDPGASRQRQFFFSSSGAAGSNPFFAHQMGDEDVGGNPQCQQM